MNKIKQKQDWRPKEHYIHLSLSQKLLLLAIDLSAVQDQDTFFNQYQNCYTSTIVIVSVCVTRELLYSQSPKTSISNIHADD